VVADTAGVAVVVCVTFSGVAVERASIDAETVRVTGTVSVTDAVDEGESRADRDVSGVAET